MISIIIPTYNEDKNIDRALKHLKEQDNCEIIVVDGGSTDDTAALAKEHLQVKVIETKKNRAIQMNAGAQAAKGDILLFLHADITLPTGALQEIEEACSTHDGGGFYIRFDSTNPVFRLMEFHSNQIRLGLSKKFFGDQCIFVKRGFFHKINGFDELPFLEDMVFSKKAKKNGKMKVIKKRVVASARRFNKNGVVKTSTLFALIQYLHTFGVGVERLHKIYGWLQ